MQSIRFARIHFNEQNTPISEQFDDIYFNTQDGLAESDYVFLQGNQLWERWQRCTESHFVIAETGFGTGLNFLLVAQLFQKFRKTTPHFPLKRLFFISFEKYPLNQSQLKQAHQHYAELQPLAQQLQEHWVDPTSGCYRFHFGEQNEINLDLWFGDIQDNLPQLGDYMNNKVDAWFLDGFAPSKNPDMWNEKVYEYMFVYSKPQGTFATFTAASHVRKELENVGFEVQKRKGFGAKRECLYGAKTLDNPQNLLKTPWYLPQSANFESQADVGIIGGGIASLFTAISLLERGAKVTLYCQDEQPALNASGNKQGAFYPQLSDDDERNIRFYLHAFAYGQQRLHWAIKQGIDFEYNFCGVALCGYSEKAQAKLDKIAALSLPQSIYQPLNKEKLSEKVGLPLPCGGGFIPNGAWLSPRVFVQNAFKLAEKLGLIVKTQKNCTALLQHEQGWQLTFERGDMATHQIVVIANGHKLPQFEQTKMLPTYAVRGQVSQIPTSENLLKLKTVLCYDGYLTPVDFAKTSHCIGASHVRNDETRHFSLQEQQENQQKIQKNIIESWTKDVDTSDNLARIGVRCTVRDRIPLMGNVANYAQQVVDYRNLFNLRRRKQKIEVACNYPNLFVIGALGSRGLTSAPLLGETLASQIYGEPLPLSEDIIHCLSANRSWMRKLLKGSIL